MENFAELELPYALNSALRKMQYEKPTPIQAKSIPLALEGRDILGSAQTGTGKTAAFGIPLVAHLMNNSKGSALVLCPTRELAMQVMGILKELTSRQKSIKSALLIGGESMGKQFTQLAQRPRIIVGTPGRINDHLERGKLMLHDAKFLVLDETDRMLDMGFESQLEEMFRYLPKVRQTLLFSATLPGSIVKISKKYLNNPERIAVDPTNETSKNVEIKEIKIAQGEKFGKLVEELGDREGSILVFVKTKRGCDNLAEKLHKKGFKVRAIHGDLKQSQRKRVLQGFRDEDYRILIATDVAARGLDVPHIEHVVNYDLPSVPEDYIHRVGRTGRAGAEGQSLCFISPEEADKWHAIQKMLDPKGDHGPAPRKGGAPSRSSGGGGKSKKPWTKNRSEGEGAKKFSPKGGRAFGSGKGQNKNNQPSNFKPSGNR
ncbi:MAG: DEAD/DEAH box helicase [Rickettsiales bacterium]|nr:DEAD/DEAH box helicase [Rickettsiales bacterium]